MLRAGVLTTSIEWFPLLMQVCCFLAFALQAQSQLQQRKKDYGKKLPHNSQAAATTTVRLKAEAIIIIQIHTNFNSSFVFEV